MLEKAQVIPGTTKVFDHLMSRPGIPCAMILNLYYKKQSR